MLEPGAKRSRHVPKFENDERASVVVVEPTVIAFAARAGDELQALVLLLPAATAIGTPELERLFTAVSSALEAPPPRLMLATAGLIWLFVTQSTPAITPEVEPEPLQSSTRTPRSMTLLATPYVEPPIVPETCVPWPLQSAPLPPNASKTFEARPPNCV